MDIEQLKEKILSVKDVSKDMKVVYEVLDELGIKYQKTTCKRCRNDLRNIALEELGLLGSAAEASDFNIQDIEIDWSYTYEYIFPHPIWWHGHKICQETPREVIEEFVHYIPQGYYRKVKVETPQDRRTRL